MSHPPSSPQQPTTHSPKPLQSSLPHQPAPQQIQATTASIHSVGQHGDDEDDSDGNDDYPPLDPQNEETSLLPPPNFQSLFTVITDPQTRETYHPSIYYVFSDDAENEREGNDVATVAALRALDQTAQRAQQQYGQDQRSEEDDLDERYIIVDLEPVPDAGGTTLKIKNASSLSPSWAVSSTTLRPAPTFQEETEEDADSLMLQIEGIELAESASNSSTTGKHGAKIKKEAAERKASDLLEQARKRANGDGVIQGMEEIWRGLAEGVGVLEKVMAEDSSLPSK
jgi:hypothetical protein